MTISNLALKLVEGTKADRDQYIDRVEVLDKVKKIITLPNGMIESKNVAEYFNVFSNTIRVLIKRHQNEFTKEEMITLKGEELKKYKGELTKLHNVTLKATAHLTLFSRRGVLRIGMLLTSSPIAEKIRDYLLNVEENATKEQKQMSFDLLKYNGEWNRELDQYVFNTVEKGIQNGKSVKSLLNEVAREIEAPEVKVRTRWYAGNKELRPLRDRLNKELKETVKNGNHLKVVHSNQIMGNELISVMNKSFEDYFINQNKLITDLMNEVKQLKSSNEQFQASFEQLHSGMEKLWRGYNVLSDSFENVIKEINKIKKELNTHNRIVNETYVDKVKMLERLKNNKAKLLKDTKQELQKAKMIIANYTMNGELPSETKGLTFKMDRNGNLNSMRN